VTHDNREYIEYHVKKSTSSFRSRIANPIQYVKDPCGVRARFRGEPRDRRQAAKYKKRIVFPSTSRSTGCARAKLDEARARSVTAIRPSALDLCCSKQLLDCVIYAYGVRDGSTTRCSAFNWIGPSSNDVMEPKEGSSGVHAVYFECDFQQTCTRRRRSRAVVHLHRRWSTRSCAYRKQNGCPRADLQSRNARNEVSVSALARDYHGVQGYPSTRDMRRAKIVVVHPKIFREVLPGYQKRVPSIAQAKKHSAGRRSDSDARINSAHYHSAQETGWVR